MSKNWIFFWFAGTYSIIPWIQAKEMRKNVCKTSPRALNNQQVCAHLYQPSGQWLLLEQQADHGTDGNPTRSRITTSEAKSRETFGDEQMPYVMQEKLGQATGLVGFRIFCCWVFPRRLFQNSPRGNFPEKMGFNDRGLVGGWTGWTGVKMVVAMQSWECREELLSWECLSHQLGETRSWHL